MCARFFLTRFDPRKDLDLEVEAEEAEKPRPRYNIAPSQKVLAVRAGAHGGKARLSGLRWGLVPHWAKDIKIGYSLINARSETVLQKPSFREAFKKRRCLIPAEGFYEWKKLDAKHKQPYRIGMKDGKPFAFAGLWESWRSPEGLQVDSCSILTTSSNELVAEVHDRMPVILPRNTYDAWLNTPPEQAQGLLELLVPYEAGAMAKSPVSTVVNNPKNDVPECLAKAG